MACTGIFVMAVAAQVVPAVLAPMAKEFHRDLAQRGVLLLLGPAGFILSTLLSGWLSDRWGARLFIVTGFAFMTGGLALSAWAPDYRSLQGGLLMIGVSGGFIESPLSSVISSAFPERRAQMLNVTQLFYNLGAVAGPALVALALGLGWGWRSGFGLCVALGVLTMMLSFFGLRGQTGGATDAAHGSADARVVWWVVWAVATAMFLYVASEMTIAMWSANYLERTFGVISSRAALTVSGFWLGMGVGRALYVVIVSRTGYLLPLLFSAILAAVAAVGAAFAQTPLAAALLCAGAGFFFGGSWPTMLGYAANRNPGRTGTVFGIIVSAGAAGSLVGPPLGGWLAEHSRHGLRLAMLLGAAAAVAEGCVVLYIFLRERRERGGRQAGVGIMR